MREGNAHKRKCTEFAGNHRYPRLEAFTAFKFTITMSGHRLVASLRRLGGQNRSESHLPDVSSGPEQLEGERSVRFASFPIHLY